MKILNLEPAGFSAVAARMLHGLGEVHTGPLSRQDLMARIGDYDVLIVRLAHQIDRTVLDAAPRLKVIVSATTALDHIDVSAATGRRIEIISLKGQTEFLQTIFATPEHTMALMLALVRNLPAAAWSAMHEKWNRDCFRGSELFGKTLGLIGFGRVAKAVAGYASAFGMKVVFYDPFARDAGAGEALASLPALMSQSDVVSIHVELNDSTRGLVGEPALRAMRAGSYLINTSRGRILDEKALLAALESNQIAGAALDVLADEHQFRDATHPGHPLIAFARNHPRRLIITPHIAGATVESTEKTEVFVVEKLCAYVNGTREKFVSRL